jgi:pimeloyl-ACP methyl ester carboxylesterase
LDTEYGQVHYITAGTNSGTPILLLHKTPRSIDEYRDVIPILSEKYNVVAMDTIGYGDSDKPKAVLTIEDYAGIVRLLLDELKIKKAVIVGHLTGSVIGVEVTAAYPDMVDKLVLSGPIYMDEKTRREHARMFAQWHVKADGSHIVELWQERVKRVSNPALIHRLVVDVLKCGETSENAHISVANYHMEDRLPLIKCPVLLIIGKKDPFVYPEKCKMFKKVLPNSREVLLEEGALFVPDELPETFAKLVISFVENG